jgi:hypothetical protein
MHVAERPAASARAVFLGMSDHALHVRSCSTCQIVRKHQNAGARSMARKGGRSVDAYTWPSRCTTSGLGARCRANGGRLILILRRGAALRRRWTFRWNHLERSHRRASSVVRRHGTWLQAGRSPRPRQASAECSCAVPTYTAQRVASAESGMRLLLVVVATVTNIPTSSGLEPRLAARRPLTL